MVKAVAQLRFFTDENIPDSIVRYLQGRGHSVYRAKSHLPEGSPDPVVATTAMEADRILLTWDKDFNDQRFQKPRYARLSRIGLSGQGPDLLPAVKKHIRVIEFQWAEAKRAKFARMVAFARLSEVKFRS